MTSPSTSPANEHCWRCGVSVAFGGGHFVNRVPDLNQHPRGDFVCADCDEGKGNCVFPTPWQYHMELHSDDAKDSLVAVSDATGHEFASYEGDCEGAHCFIDSAQAMEAAHQLLDACKILLKVVVENCDAEEFGSEISHAEGVIADAERA